MRIFSGIQPTGQKHLGNYIGGFRQYAATQELGEGFFCIVDLHSITVDYDPEELRAATIDLAAMLFASGLDPARSTTFAQSHVKAHAEAAWLLGSVTSFGELRRMTQFKDKGDKQEFVSSGPVHVPGADGRRHPPLPDRPRPDRRRPAPAPRADAGHRDALQPAVRRDVPDPGRPLPGGRRAGDGPPGADEQDVDDRRHADGDGARRRRARRDPQEVQGRRHRLRPRRAPRAGQAGRHEPRRHHVGRRRACRPRRSRTATTARATASSSRTSPRR